MKNELPVYVLTAALGGLFAAGPASAAIETSTWTFDSASCVGTCSALPGDASQTYQPGAGDPGPNLDVSGWANTGPLNGTMDNYRIAAEQIVLDQGLGVNSQSVGDPDANNTERRRVDNVLRIDLVLFDFTTANADATWEVTQIDFGSVPSGDDLDVSLFRWIGAGTPDLTSYYIDSIDNGDGFATSLIGPDAWDLVGNFDLGPTSGGGVLNLSTGLESGYWLAAAYTEAFGAGCDPVGYCQGNNDKFKIVSVTGQNDVPPTNGAPEPATLLLLAGGLPFVLRRRRVGRTKRA